MNRRRFLSSVSAAALVGAFPLAAMVAPAVKAASLEYMKVSWYGTMTYAIIHKDAGGIEVKLTGMSNNLIEAMKVEKDAQR